MADRFSLGTTVAGIVALLACGGGYAVARANYHDHVATCTVREKDRGQRSDSDGSHYRIYTDQCGTLSNEDQWLKGKTNSADIQGRLQVGHTYRLRIVGWRNSLTSSFPNIVAIEGEVH